MQARLLFGLLDGVVTGLAEALQVGFIPEQIRIASMCRLVIRDEPGRIALEPTADPACEEIAKQDAPSELLPSRGFVPAPPGLLVTLLAWHSGVPA